MDPINLRMMPRSSRFGLARVRAKMSRTSPSPLVAGSRVYLRHPRKGDMDEFTHLVIASRRFLHPWVTPASTPEAYTRYLQYSRRKSVCACLVCRSEDL